MTDLASLVTAEEGRNILLLGSPLDDPTTDAHRALLAGQTPGDQRVLCITYRDSPGTVVTRWQNHTDVTPAKWGIIVMGDQAQSAETGSAPPSGAQAGPRVEAVTDPGDLTALGITLSQYLERWTGDEHPFAVCVDSVTALLQYVDEQIAFRFMHMATTRFRAANAVGHFHLDSDAHSDRTIAEFKSIVDTVVDVSGKETTVLQR